MIDASDWLLILSALGTSIISGTIGMAGGIVLLAIMAEFFAPTILIPLHGCVQLVSNVSRTFILREHLKAAITGPFILGGILGALAGSQFVVEIAEGPFRILIGSFILFVTFAPLPKGISFKGKWFVLGGFATFISLFVGAIGPFLAPFFLRDGLSKEQLVCTKAACQGFVHLLKIATYLFLGFTIGNYWPILLAMTVATIFGNHIGKWLLGKTPEAWFKKIFLVIIVVLAVRSIYKGLLLVS